MLFRKTYVKPSSENAMPSECNEVGLHWRDKIQKAGFQLCENIAFSKQRGTVLLSKLLAA